MAREEVIKRVWDIMLTWKENFTFESYELVIDTISNFNREHPEEEIFFCEDENTFYLELEHIVIE